MNKRFLHNAIRHFLALPVIGNAPLLVPQGNLIDAGNFTAWASYIALYGNANANFSAVTNVTTGALTLTPANCTQGLINAIVVASGGSANTNTTDTATNIITTYWPTAVVGSRATLLYVNNNSGINTLAGGTGVTITGTATIPTLALAYYGFTVTNLANPAQVGAVSTNSTTTTAAVATGAVTGTAAIIPVAASTGMNIGGYLKVTLANGTTFSSRITAINTLNITLADPLPLAVASGATVLVYNNTLAMLRLFSTVTATTAA
jgi:hypothetical protein